MMKKSAISNAKILAAEMLSDPFINYRFRIEIEGIEMMGFSKMSELANETSLEEYREGGVNNYVHKLPNSTSYKNIILEHGIGVDNTIYNWRQDVIDGNLSEALRSGTIKVYGQNFMRSIWHFHGAWPVSLEIGELDAGDDKVLIEKVELVIERFERTVIADPTDIITAPVSKAISKISNKAGKVVGTAKRKVTGAVSSGIEKGLDTVTKPIEDGLDSAQDGLR